MFEARIIYEDGRNHTVEANNLEMIKIKDNPLIEEEKVIEITVVELNHIGYLKTPFDIQLL